MLPLGIIPELLFHGKDAENQKGVITELLTNEKMQENIRQSVTPSLGDWLGVKKKIAEIAEQLHQQALLTPDPNDDKIDFVKYLYEYAGAAPITQFMPDWFREIVIYFTALFNQVAHNSVQFVFKNIYEFVTKIVLFTPEWIFDNSWFPSAVSKFSSVSIGIVIIFAMIEGVKRMCKMSHTPFTETLKKLPLALGVSAATPFLFSNGLKLLNKITDFILQLSVDEIGSNKAIGIFASSIAFEPINALMMILFLIIVTILCLPMILLHARRWFDFILLGMLTPLAMSAWLFRATEEYFHFWLRGIRNLTLLQLAYAFFISALGILLFATPSPTSFAGILTKSLIMIGGMYRLAFPPHILRRFDDNNGSMIQMIKQMKGYGDDKIEKGKKYIQKSDDALIGSAKIAGKAYRITFKK